MASVGHNLYLYLFMIHLITDTETSDKQVAKFLKSL